MDLAIRLPGTAHALRAGIIDYSGPGSSRGHPHPQPRRRPPGGGPDSCQGGQQTSGQLRAVLARTIPGDRPRSGAAAPEQAQKDPRIRRWREDAGTPPCRLRAAARRRAGSRPAPHPERAQDLRAAVAAAPWTSSAPAPTSMPSWAATLPSPRNRARPANLPAGQHPAVWPGRWLRGVGAPASTPPSGPHAGSAASGRRPAPGRPGPLTPRRLQRPRCRGRRLILSRPHRLRGRAV